MAASSEWTRGRDPPLPSGAMAGAEGATAPESLRQKDRADRTFWKEPGFALGHGGPPKVQSSQVQ
jgi:hypothetical protein